MVQKKIRQLDFASYGATAQIATVIGRYYAMDRDKNEARTQKALDLLVSGKGSPAKDPIAAIKKQYAAGLESDYYLKPIRLAPAGTAAAKSVPASADAGASAKITKQDAVIFFNFRTDRTQQLAELLIKKIKPYFVAFGPYVKTAPVAFPAPVVKNNLATVLARKHKTQLRIAETEKYAHVTFFFNSQLKQPVRGEARVLVDSPKCPSYADQPEMSAYEVTDKLMARLNRNYDFIALNFANPDLVGHSGDVKATKKAIEVLDECLSRIVPKALAEGYTVLVTADHGNAEYMKYEDGSDCASHSINPVPFILVSTDGKQLKATSHSRANAGLKDIAPTVLKLMGVSKPWQMKGQSLV